MFVYYISIKLRWGGPFCFKPIFNKVMDKALCVPLNSISRSFSLLLQEGRLYHEFRSSLSNMKSGARYQKSLKSI